MLRCRLNDLSARSGFIRIALVVFYPLRFGLREVRTALAFFLPTGSEIGDCSHMLVALGLHCSKLSAAWDCKPNGVQGIAGGIVACSDAGIHYWDPDDWDAVVIHEEDGVCGLLSGESGELEVVVT